VVIVSLPTMFRRIQAEPLQDGFRTIHVIILPPQRDTLSRSLDESTFMGLRSSTAAFDCSRIANVRNHQNCLIRVPLYVGRQYDIFVPWRAKNLQEATITSPTIYEDKMGKVLPSPRPGCDRRYMLMKRVKEAPLLCPEPPLR
jgi:hypothetical protein